MDVNQLFAEAAWAEKRRRSGAGKTAKASGAGKRTVSRNTTSRNTTSRNTAAGNTGGKTNKQRNRQVSQRQDHSAAVARLSRRKLNDLVANDPIHRYPDGRAYLTARGRQGDSIVEVVDDRDWRRAVAVIDLRSESPSAMRFINDIVREMKIRNYTSGTVDMYRSAAASFMKWSGWPPNRLTREHVREYLEYLVDSGQSAATVSWHLSAIRTTFDKLCFQDITLGLTIPRKGKRLPVVLSKPEVQRLLQAAVSLRDKLLLGLMYACGLRVSEVVSLRWRDIDMDRNVICVWQGKGRADRMVMLPNSYRGLFSRLIGRNSGDSYLFPSESVGRARSNSSRYLSVRTVQRIMKRTVELAGIDKPATPHSLRHSFATHSFEDGCDIRRIQKILGHVNLETTTIYLKTAKPADPSAMPSPLDRLGAGDVGVTTNGHLDSQLNHQCMDQCCPEFVSLRKRMGVHAKQIHGESFTRVTVSIERMGRRYFLTGIRATQSRPGFWTLQIPPLEDWGDVLSRLGQSDTKAIESVEFNLALRAEIERLVLRGA